MFSDLFSLPARLVSAAEGSSDDNPIHLESIDPNDFRRLLMVLYPEYVANSRDPSVLATEAHLGTV